MYALILIVFAAIHAFAVQWNYSATNMSFYGSKDHKAGLYGFEDIAVTAQNFQAVHNISPSNKLVVSTSYLINSVETKIGGKVYSDSTEGLADTTLLVTQMIPVRPMVFVIAQAGVSLPTGSITEKNQNNTQLNYAYNMQLGSGTVDPVAGAVLIGISGPWTWDSSIYSIFRTSKNSQGYQLGNDYHFRAGIERAIVPKYFRAHLKSFMRAREAIKGQDQTFGRSAFTEYYHHRQSNWDISLGLASDVALTDTLTAKFSAQTPLAQDLINHDKVVVSNRFSATVGLSGQF